MFAPAEVERRTFELSAFGAAAAIALVSSGFALAALLVAEPRVFNLESVMWRAAAAAGIAIRSPAPVLLLALVLERIFPLISNQRSVTRGLGQDLVWYAVDYARELSWIPLLFVLLFWLKHSTLGERDLLPQGVTPAPILWGIGILAGDFLAYWSHRLRHGVTLLWNFHAVHHSQRELNFFTQNRFHDVDELIDLTIRTLPLLMLNAGWPLVGLYAAISQAHFRLYHSNIRGNYGFFRYILVTPQLHRIHHGRDARHLNRNFGVFFSFWDRAFGTQYVNHEEYPEALGIEDQEFPIEQGTRVRDFPRVFAAQMVYPFRKMLRSDG